MPLFHRALNMPSLRNLSDGRRENRGGEGGTKIYSLYSCVSLLTSEKDTAAFLKQKEKSSRQIRVALLSSSFSNYILLDFRHTFLAPARMQCRFLGGRNLSSASIQAAKKGRRWTVDSGGLLTRGKIGGGRKRQEIGTEVEEGGFLLFFLLLGR